MDKESGACAIFISSLIELRGYGKNADQRKWRQIHISVVPSDPRPLQTDMRSLSDRWAEKEKLQATGKGFFYLPGA